jgi:hypothetical protein
MRLAETISTLTAFDHRSPGSDAERRAADWLAAQLRESGRDARVEPFWYRPNWALAHAWHVALAIAGSLVSVSEPAVGGAIVLAATLSVIADAVTGYSPGRRLTLERASQNVVAAAGDDEERVRLLITANYDAGHTGLVYRDGVRALAARARRIAGDIAPGWLAWIVVAFAWLLATAILRNQGSHGTGVGVAQLIPTAGLVIGLALLLELGSSPPGPAAGDNASGVAVALALARALDAAPPRQLAVEVLLQGASDGSGIGLRKHLRGRRRQLKPSTAVVLGIAPAGAGTPRFYLSDGALVPVGYLPRLRALAAKVATEEVHLGAAPHRNRGTSPALAARARGIPAITIGALDERGLVPRSHQPTDAADRVDDAALDATLTFALALSDAIDAELARIGEPDRPQPNSRVPA